MRVSGLWDIVKGENNMAQQEDGGPAFPSEAGSDQDGYYPRSGMSLRDYFAGQALAGLMADVSILAAAGGRDAGFVAKLAYDAADGMLDARKQNGSPER
jgi:hypothetical protein